MNLDETIGVDDNKLERKEPSEENARRPRPDYFQERLPTLTSESQQVWAAKIKKNRCRHIGTKKMKFGFKATARGLVQRYYCYGCNGTFTSSQQMLNEYL